MTALSRVEEALRAAGSKEVGRGMWTCPAHQDSTASLSVKTGKDGRVLLKCFAGCRIEEVLKRIGLEKRDLFEARTGGRGDSAPRRNRATVQPPGAGLTLAQYAAAKRLPEDFLRELGLRDVSYFPAPAVQIPYFTATASDVPMRYRMRIERGREGDDRFRWQKGSKVIPYGLWRLDQARAAGHIVLVEGESDCHTLWLHELPALGLPGANTWRDDWAGFLAGFAVIYAIEEPDRGGKTLRVRLSASPLVDRLRFVSLGAYKDPSDLHVASPTEFKARFSAALGTALPAAEAVELETKRKAAAAWERCEALARQSHILDTFEVSLRRMGTVGEERAARLLYLAVTSRLLEQPVSVAVKGPSAAGKSYTTERVLRFFPPSAFFALTAMSERALAYSEEPLSHRILVIYEGAGLQGDFASYLVRSLLSEGCIRYETVEKTADGMRARLIERPGPTGLIVTTTLIRLHPENETRLFSIPVDDTAEQTGRVLLSLANGRRSDEDFDDWHALAEWLGSGERRVVIPYAKALAQCVKPAAVRLRRDFGALLNLIRSHALLHRATRVCSETGIVASLEDYVAVRELVADLIGEAAQLSVSKTIRETVAAVVELTASGDLPATGAAIARSLGLDKSAASRRIRAGVEAGYLRNLEERKFRPARIVPGDPLPIDSEILPTPELLAERLHGCTGAEGDKGSGVPPASAPAFEVHEL